jgi:hypothetical protein
MDGWSSLTWSPGAQILYQAPGNWNFQVLDPETGNESPLFDDPSARMSNARYAPDGDQVAVGWYGDEDGLRILSLTKAFATKTLGRAARPIGWSADGHLVYCQASFGVFGVPVDGSERRVIVVVPFKDVGDVSMSPDGRRVVCSVYEIIKDAWLVENFDPNVK